MADEWYYARDGEAVGPFTLGDLKAGLAQVPDWQDLRVWREGFDAWRKAGDVEELAGGSSAPLAVPKRQDAQARPPSKAATTEQRSPRKRSIGKVLAGIVLLAVIIIAGVFGKFIATTVKGFGARRPAVTVDNKIDAAAEQALEERIAKSFEGFEATLPTKIDDPTTLISAKHAGGKVTFGYRLAVDGSRLSDQVKAKVREIATKDICAEKRSREILDLGGTFHLDYVDKDEKPVTAVDIAKSNCP
jgi:hypothetical protein